MVLKHPGAAQTPKTTDLQPNPKHPSAKPPSGNRRAMLRPSIFALFSLRRRGRPECEATMVLRSRSSECGLLGRQCQNTDASTLGFFNMIF